MCKHSLSRFRVDSCMKHRSPSGNPSFFGGTSCDHILYHPNQRKKWPNRPLLSPPGRSGLMRTVHGRYTSTRPPENALHVWILPIHHCSSRRTCAHLLLRTASFCVARRTTLVIVFRESFIANAVKLPRTEEQTQVNHKDGDPCNNHLNNLEWVVCPLAKNNSLVGADCHVTKAG